VIVCVDYADFLEVTLPFARGVADDIVVVTAPGDRRTLDVVARSGVRCIESTAMREGGRRFSLGAGINAGLQACRLDDWVLVLDADIVLPGTAARRTLETVGLVPSKLYGIDRVHCRGRAAWDAFAAAERVVRHWEIRWLRDFPMGARIRFPDDRGYAPCGFFQLWHPRHSGVRDYPVHPAGTAEGSDMLHAERWGRPWREHIPEIVAIQLESDAPDDPVGVNWAGRRTPEFSIERGPYRRL